MSTQRDFDRTTQAWLAEGPNELADRVLDAALREIHETRPARRGLFAPWRFPQMHLNARLAAPVLLIVTVAALGWAALGGVGSPSPSPTVNAPSTAPTLAPTSSPSALACGHQLVSTLLLNVGCAYTSTIFAHTLTITAADPWLVGDENPDSLSFSGYGLAVQNAEAHLIYLGDISDGGCLTATAPPPTSPLPRTAATYAAWLRLAVPTAVGPVSATVGGLPAMQFTIPTPDAACQAITLGSTAGPTQDSTYLQCFDNPCTLLVIEDGGRLLLIETLVRSGLPEADPQAAERFLGGLRFAP